MTRIEVVTPYRGSDLLRPFAVRPFQRRQRIRRSHRVLQSEFRSEKTLSLKPSFVDAVAFSRGEEAIRITILLSLGRTNKSHRASLLCERSPYLGYHRAPGRYR